MTDEYLYFDEIEDVLSSVDLLAMIVPLVDEQPSYWKWIIVAAHSALQGAMVCALAATSSIPALEKKSAEKMRKYLETGEGQPEQWLAKFDQLLERCRDGKCMSDKPLQLSAAQVSQLSKLNDHFRNEFIHFKPQGWYIERALLPQIILTTVEIVEMLMAHPLVLYKIEDENKKRLDTGLESLWSHLNGAGEASDG